jgi:hypothetical protein
MEKNIIKEERVHQHSLNCRIGRFFVLPDQDGYGRNASAAAKNVFPADAASRIRTGSHCRVKPPGRRSFR